ncbi:hypothetical protein PN450_14195 [Dolichospermum lemmermannii CS-548]|uniref:hypothetical protein n=1 Tax=Dolichospermum TaxID=748770 RepID=UPI0014489A8F|nr:MULTISPECIES: hypothetical protein [Dolichospermum]MDB9437918.1 hypothetical protein [Dolichospermum lemmermannii CS-548]MTJ20935.1 hypothetical protein [Dolichospermum sp. UHCC 0352]
MQVIENHELFSELSNDESAEMNGGAGAAQGANAVAVFLTANGGVPLTPAQGVLASITTLA